MLDFLIIPTYSTKLLGIADNSVYSDTPVSPTLKVTIPGFGIAVISFTPNDFNVLNSGTLELTDPGDSLVPLPDGVYTIEYNISPAHLNKVTKSIMRVEQLQEKFDEAFMSLDMMECDLAIKKQHKNELNTIYLFIQAAIAAANNCNTEVANSLYQQAARQLRNFKTKTCKC